jgi:XTP/dITP diphosphohydrolase
LTDKKLLLATTNQGKIKEFKGHLARLPVHMFSLRDLDHCVVFQETGSTFMENARGKGLFYSQCCENLTLAEDSGLSINHLNGAPGVISSRFAGPEATDEENIQKALSLLEEVPWEKRQAQFICCMVLCKKGNIIKEISEHVEGFIAPHKRGNKGFGYDPIFFYPPLNKTFAELMPREKNAVSHRGRALARLTLFLSEYLT